MAKIRKPDEIEPNPDPSKTRSRRLRDALAGPWYEDNDVCLVYWSPVDGGRWVLWRDPDPLVKAAITIKTK